MIKKLIILSSSFLFLVACDSTETDEMPEIDDEIVEEEEEKEIEEVSELERIDRDPSVETLVNKEYHLTENDIPDDLVTVEVDTVFDNEEANSLREVAANALEEMFAAAAEDGYKLYARSGYRSYQTQVWVFENNVDKHGEEKAATFSARPGQSEHQTGLVMDVTSENVDFQLIEEFGETDEGIWVAENAHHFGYIVRYPKGKEDITQYIYEPWHLRYIGKDLAELVYDSGLTYEEFIEKEGILDEVKP